MFQKFLKLPFKWHLLIGFLIRIIVIFYGKYHDAHFTVPYTDVDYKVFTDAARHVVENESPYNRHTYRYSPIIAFLMIPNVTVSPDFGKVLFSIFDILITVAVKVVVENQLKTNKKAKTNNISHVAKLSSLFWLYNPMSIGISTRGNADSFPCFCIILSILFLLTETVKGFSKYVLSGIFLGFSVHLRLYPLAFCFPMYLSLGDYKMAGNTTVFKSLMALLPNMKQLLLVSSCGITLISLTYGMYILYGYEFLFETYIFHFLRKDMRHNFSIFFYYSYLTMDYIALDTVKVVCQMFEVGVLITLSLAFGTEPKTLPFALFCQTVVLVAYNTVLTSQYFIWFLSLLPLVVHSFKIIPMKAFIIILIWVLAQMMWLFYAYLLEFECREVFNLLWWKGVIFFCTNVFALACLIKGYSPGYGFGKLHVLDKND